MSWSVGILKNHKGSSQPGREGRLITGGSCSPTRHAKLTDLHLCQYANFQPAAECSYVAFVQAHEDAPTIAANRVDQFREALFILTAVSECSWPIGAD
jgi:hypothetical protein